MARSQITFNKKEREKKKLQKRKEKEAKREEKKGRQPDNSLENMMAYLDENGNITSTQPDTKTQTPIKAKDIEIAVPKQSKEDLMAERRGKVAFFNEAKGYGFIKQDGTAFEYFVHVDNVVSGMIREGEKVGFEIAKGPKGMVAVKVKLLANSK